MNADDADLICVIRVHLRPKDIERQAFSGVPGNFRHYSKCSIVVSPDSTRRTN